MNRYLCEAGFDVGRIRVGAIESCSCPCVRKSGDPGTNSVMRGAEPASGQEPCEIDAHGERRFEDLYGAHYNAIHRYFIRRGLAGDADAADLAADVFLTAWRRRDAIPFPPQDRAWLFGVAHHALSKHRRGLSRRSRLSERLVLTAEIDHFAIDQESAHSVELIRNEIANLSKRDQEALKLVLWDDLSHAEAAQVLGCSEGAISVRLHRARTRLRKRLAKTDPSLFSPTIETPTSDDTSRDISHVVNLGQARPRT